MEVDGGRIQFLGVLVFIKSPSYLENVRLISFCLPAFFFSIRQQYSKTDTMMFESSVLSSMLCWPSKRLRLTRVCTERIVISVFCLCVSAVATRWWCAAEPTFALGLHVGPPTVAAPRRGFFTEPSTVLVAQAEGALHEW